MKNLVKIYSSLLAVSPFNSYAANPFNSYAANCQGFMCSLNVSPSEIKDFFQCPGPDFPNQQYVAFGFGGLEPPFFGGSFYQSIRFDVDFQPPEKLELKAFDQSECSELKEKYKDLFSFIITSDWHFRLPNSGYLDPHAVFNNIIYSVKVLSSNFNSSNNICTLETDYKNKKFVESFMAENGDRSFRVLFININEKLIYTDSHPKILEMFKNTSVDLTVTGIR